MCARRRHQLGDALRVMLAIELSVFFLRTRYIDWLQSEENSFNLYAEPRNKGWPLHCLKFPVRRQTSK